MKLHQNLLNQAKFPFPKLGNHVSAPTELGVYVIYDKKDIVLHVGRTPRAKNGIYQRLGDHLKGSSSFYREYLYPKKIDLRKGHFFQFLVVLDDQDRAYLEALTVGLLCPKHIGTGR